MCVVPITVAVFAMSPWGNGWDYFIWGTVAALTGPPAYFIFKRIYGGQKALDAERAASGAAPAGSRGRHGRPAADVTRGAAARRGLTARRGHSRPQPARPGPASVAECVVDEAGQQLGIEVRRLLRHDLALVGDRAHLVDAGSR